jgi:hypothetical protein
MKYYINKSISCITLKISYLLPMEAYQIICNDCLFYIMAQSTTTYTINKIYKIIEFIHKHSINNVVKMF